MGATVLLAALNLSPPLSRGDISQCLPGLSWSVTITLIGICGRLQTYLLKCHRKFGSVERTGFAPKLTIKLLEVPAALLSPVIARFFCGCKPSGILLLAEHHRFTAP